MFDCWDRDGDDFLELAELNKKYYGVAPKYKLDELAAKYSKPAADETKAPALLVTFLAPFKNSWPRKKSWRCHSQL